MRTPLPQLRQEQYLFTLSNDHETVQAWMTTISPLLYIESDEKRYHSMPPSV